MIQSSAVALATGKSGSINVYVRSADVEGGGAIKTSSTSTAAGDVTVVATGTVRVQGQPSEIATGTSALSGNVLAGQISVTAADLVLSDRARIRSGDADEQAGRKMVLNASNSVTSPASLAFKAKVFLVKLARSKYPLGTWRWMPDS